MRDLSKIKAVIKEHISSARCGITSRCTRNGKVIKRKANICCAINVFLVLRS